MSRLVPLIVEALMDISLMSKGVFETSLSHCIDEPKTRNAWNDPVDLTLQERSGRVDRVVPQKILILTEEIQYERWESARRAVIRPRSLDTNQE
jgi:hypothetical protein